MEFHQLKTTSIQLINYHIIYTNTTVGTTYMAACGLETTRRNSTHSNLDDDHLGPKYNVVEVMVQFAAEMMAILQKMKLESSKPYK